MTEVLGLDPRPFRDMTMLILKFHFEGSRKKCASRLLERPDLSLAAPRIKEHLHVIDKIHPGEKVRKVELVSYRGGHFYYDPLQAGNLLDEHYAHHHA